MTAKAVLTSAIRRIEPLLNARGYVRRSLSFFQSGVVLDRLIEFQVRRTSSVGHLSFVINFGIIVTSLLDEGYDDKNPIWTQCHWGKRVSASDGKEVWWPVAEVDSADELAAKVAAALELAVFAEIDAKQSEDDFIALWSTGSGPNLTHARRLLLLGKLLHRAGRLEELRRVREELEKIATSSFSIRAANTLRELES